MSEEITDTSAEQPVEATQPESTPAKESKPAEQGEGGKPEGQDEAPKQKSFLGEDEPEEAESKEQSEPIEYKDFQFEEDFLVNEEQLGEFKKLAQDARLSQEQAQKMLDLYTKTQKEQLTSWMETTNKWYDEIKKDPELAGENGKKLNETQEAANRALRTYFSKETIKEFMDMGITNHPGFVRGLYMLGKQLGEGESVKGETLKETTGWY